MIGLSFWSEEALHESLSCIRMASRGFRHDGMHAMDWLQRRNSRDALRHRSGGYRIVAPGRDKEEAPWRHIDRWLTHRKGHRGDWHLGTSTYLVTVLTDMSVDEYGLLLRCRSNNSWFFRSRWITTRSLIKTQNDINYFDIKHCSIIMEQK